MGDHHGGLAVLVDRTPHQVQDLATGPGVEVPVGSSRNHRRRDHQRPGDRDPLLLTAGQSAGRCESRSARPTRSISFVEEGVVGLLGRRSSAAAGVVARGQHRQQVEELEDEADVPAAQGGSGRCRRAW